MAARSTQVTIVNGSGYTLSLSGSGLNHGVWNGGPVPTVTPNVIRVVGNNESDGFLTGDQGWISYDVLNGSNKIGSITVSWDNPFAGGNSYGCVASGTGFYIAQQEGGSGNNASVSFIFCVANPYSGS